MALRKHKAERNLGFVGSGAIEGYRIKEATNNYLSKAIGNWRSDNNTVRGLEPVYYSSGSLRAT